ncbi:unnamed protein product [Adineta steineri]|uniref:Carbohydrate sulfotransferase n=1 Tax=Adineta steineri TaxID=433720 RepID=A0A814NDU0_9BILA|nr:unnamed protein product [Adineta steineri]CAF1182888.1 unnamed protein product [Adineta steineri]
METNSTLWMPMIYEHRSQILNSKCNDSYTLENSITNCSSASLIRKYPWLKAALFSLQSQSLMYCAIPKVASKTLISVIMYVHVRDIVTHLSNNSTNINIKKTRPEQLINIPKLINQLQKNEIPIPKTEGSISFDSLMQTYLHLLRFESINSASPSLYFNPWSLSLKEIFRSVDLKSISNLSDIFSPSFTRVMFVRHPFARLASAYKERIAILETDRIQREPHYNSIRKLICRRYTHTRWIIDPLQEDDPCEDFIPSFKHFLEYILTDTNTFSGIALMDAHWQPYTVICQVCKFKYNFIGKYETFDNDFNSLLKRLNISDWNNEKRRGASGHKTSNYQQLFSSLPDNLICQLKRLYNDDLQFFNYRIEDYVNRTTLTC